MSPEGPEVHVYKDPMYQSFCQKFTRPSRIKGSEGCVRGLFPYCITSSPMCFPTMAIMIMAEGDNASILIKDRQCFRVSGNDVIVRYF